MEERRNEERYEPKKYLEIQIKEGIMEGRRDAERNKKD
jgi:hypothetical protein